MHLLEVGVVKAFIVSSLVLSIQFSALSIVFGDD